MIQDLPAILATKPYPGVSSNYVFISTGSVLSALLEQGWKPVSAKQTKSRSAEKAPYARHMVVLANEQLPAIDDPRTGASGTLHMQLILVNGHDGSATYSLYAGLFSFVCANGLIVGDMLDSVRVRHMGLRATVEAVSQGAARLMSAEMPKLADSVTTLARREMTRSEQHDFARYALELRYKGVTPVLTTDQVLERHRNEDQDNSVWTVMNVIQENLMNRTHSGRSFNGRRTTIRGVKAIKEQVAINRGLWNYAAKLAS